MALIKCPECGKEISDKSSICVHCGFPLKSNNTKNLCIIDGTPFDLSSILQIAIDFWNSTPNATANEESKVGLAINRKIRELSGINDLAGATLAAIILNERSIPKTFNSKEYPDPDFFNTFNPNVLCCPRCGSTVITTGARGVNWKLGFIGASKTVNRCAKCGHMWEPRR